MQLFLLLYLVPFLLSSFCFLAPSLFAIVFIAWLVTQGWRYHWNCSVQRLGSFYCWVGSICVWQVWKGQDICIREEEIAPTKWRNGISSIMCRETWSQPQNNEPVVDRIKSFLVFWAALLLLLSKLSGSKNRNLFSWVFLEKNLQVPCQVHSLLSLRNSCII